MVQDQERVDSCSLPGYSWSIRTHRACGVATYSEKESPLDAKIIWSGELHNTEKPPSCTYKPKNLGKDIDPSGGSLIAAKVGKAARKFTRQGDTEFQALSHALTVFPEPTSSGLVRIYVDKVPCLSCVGAFAQFMHKRPNVKIEIAYDDSHEYYMPAFQAVDPFANPANTSFEA